MEEIIKHINDTNASYRDINAGDAKNTDLFLDNEQYDLFKDCGEQIIVRFNKENLTKAILFIASILPRKFDQSANHYIVNFSKEFVLDQLALLDALFTVDNSPVETITQTWNVRINIPKKNGEIDRRFYFNGLLKDITFRDSKGIPQKTKFTIRNYLAGGYSELHIKKSPHNIFDVTIVNATTPHDDGKEFYLEKDIPNFQTEYFLQQIYYGAPGTGKSHTINDITKKEDVIRTTFHPDTDYSTFVGAYKPTTIEETVMTVIGKEAVPVRDANGEEYKESKIIYEFVPQAFLQAYIAAWKEYANSENKEPRKQYLVIEEINRGNCAQIFGDLFQLLDRNDNGFSEYPIKADTDMKNQLQKAFKGLNIPQKDSINEIFKEHCDDIVKEVLEGDSLLLPNNLYIWATMNTSDQSLFPIDSAFKRRWDWQYIPISNAHKNWKIKVGDNYYDWWQFIETINALIGKITNSEDKKLGYFFCKADANNNIKADRFVGKVLFYLWNDVFKDYDFCDPVFNDADGNKITFDKFYTAEGNDSKIVEEQVELFLKNLHLNPVENDGEEDLDSEDVEDKNGRDTTHYSINGEGDFPKLLLAKELIERFVKMHPELSAEDVIRQWKGLSTVSHFIENDNEHERRTEDGKKRTQAVTCNDGTLVWVSTNGWDLNTVKALIEEVNSKEDWGLQVKAIE